ncbi:hypothetical protein BCCGELA001_01345 [Bradyrhizobium sp. CCGE-LA001]|nr:hypothetical protein BCCGELA001_01345 [Bradyrhizobium sp. CCGE-LA001]
MFPIGVAKREAKLVCVAAVQKRWPFQGFAMPRFQRCDALMRLFLSGFEVGRRRAEAQGILVAKSRKRRLQLDARAITTSVELICDAGSGPVVTAELMG